MSRFLLAVAAVLSLSAAQAAEPGPGDKCPPRPGFALISPEQRLMMFADMKEQAETGAVDIQVLRQMQREKMRAMSDDQRKAYFADLTKRWAALTPAKQKELKTEAAKWRAEHPRPDGAPHRNCAPAEKE